MIMNTFAVAPITATCLASELVRRRSARGLATTNLDLQKLAYFCHGWHLALLGRPLVFDEEFEAWRFGPVLPSVYHKFKVFASNPVPADSPLVQWEQCLDPKTDSSQVIDKVLEVYNRSSSFDLVNMSHDPNGPWAAAWNQPGFSNTIHNNIIQQYFQRQSAGG
jgi:uncharacterized phage-associated protein